ncbi:MAG: sarcosine oxidase subunit delta [Alphaproteobacteria bacterium]|nr:sarcosine oxidase subunit delta [Alphaproteobacteria bacterium]
MRIGCPVCGDRDAHEFTYQGDGSRTTPPLDADQDQWFAHVYERTNPMGRHTECWLHTGGCRAVLIVERDTVTHEIFSVRLAGAQAAIHDEEAGQ